ncbi:MAG TPA: thiamine pyrophosphate-dependent enzyme [Trebonia sp.]|nr:thiamine pyrophosphate-dependent enzyme [Trebonia sp.]
MGAATPGARAPALSCQDRAGGHIWPATEIFYLVNGLDRIVVDGNDGSAVRQVIGDAVRGARDGRGPSVVEAQTYRLKGHSAADSAAYRPPAEVEQWRARDPLLRALTALAAGTAAALGRAGGGHRRAGGIRLAGRAGHAGQRRQRAAARRRLA